MLSIDEHIVTLLAGAPLSAPEILLRLRELGLDAADDDVRRRLAMMFGTRVARDGGAWRLLHTPAAVSLSYLATSTCAVVVGMRAQIAAGAA